MSWDDDDVYLLTAPGWGGSGAQHWQSCWERLYPLARRAEQQDWLYPEREAWVAGIAAAVSEIPGRVVIAAHSLGCHAALAWLRQASLLEQRKVKGLLLVAPPELPISMERARAGGELPDDAPLPDFAGFEQPHGQRLPVPAIVVASRNDPYCAYAMAESMASNWGAQLADAGDNGHLGSAAQLSSWPFGQRLLQKLVL